MEQFIEPKSWDDLPVGTRVQVSYDYEYGLVHDRWTGSHPLVVGTVVSVFDYNNRTEALVMLDRSNISRAWSLSFDPEIQRIIEPKFLANVHPEQKRFWWVSNPDALRIVNPKYISPDFVKGTFTCDCGAMAVDPSVSAVINKKYVCYGCRVLFT